MMAENIKQLFDLNPAASVLSTDLFYLGRSPFDSNDDFAITWLDMQASIAGAALTRTNDTNITLTLGGNASTSLVRDASLTLGWTGTLSAVRGGTGVANLVGSTITLGGAFAMSGAFGFTGILTNTTSVTFPTSGTLLTAAGAVTSLAGTANQIAASAAVGAVTLALVSNPVLPGTGGFTWPTGNTAARAGGAGTTRFNSQSAQFEGTTDGSTWLPFDQSTSGDVDSIIGTANQIIASNPTGNVTLSLPQDIATSSSPVFAGFKDLIGNNIVTLNSSSLAVNYLDIGAAIAGSAPQISVSGADSDISVAIANKGVSILQVFSLGNSGVNFLTGTAYQHSSIFSFANTAATATYAFPDVSGTMTVLGNTSTGSGSVVLATSPSLITPVLGAASATSLVFSSTSGIIGTTTNNNAAAGSVGEYVFSQVLAASPVSLTNSTPNNITSISLTAGDWTVTGNINVAYAAGGSAALCWTSSTSVTQPDASLTSGPNMTGSTLAGAYVAIAPRRYILSGTTTIYLSCLPVGIGAIAGCGFIGATRTR